MTVKRLPVVGITVAVGLVSAAVLLVAAVARLADGTIDSQAPAIILGGLAIAASAVALLVLVHRWQWRAQATLQDSIESVSCGVATFRSGRLIAWNAAFVELLALAPGVMVTGRAATAIEQDERTKANSMLGDLGVKTERARESGRPVVFERQRSDGAIVELTYRPHGGDGLSIVVTDVTARRRADNSLRHAQKMEVLGQMTGGIAHDFNNLLTVVILNLDYIQNDKSISEKHARRLRLALDAALRGSKVARQLLAFARKQPLEPEIVVPAEAMPSLLELVRRAVGDAVEVEFVSSFDMWSTVLDPLQFEAAILNIALNATAAMPKGGKLTIELANVSLDEAYAARHSEVSPGQYILIALSDTGAGMPVEPTARVFDTAKPEGEGSGLGLSMVHDFVKQSGGHIKIYSEPGHGTSVKLYFKRNYEGAVDRPAVRQALPTAGNETILVVEDDANLRATVTAALKELGYTVLSAPNGAAGLILLESTNRVDLLFTDMVMPGPVSTSALVQAARELQPAIKILFTSGYPPNAVIHHEKLAPHTSFLSKPYRNAQLAEAIKDVLARETV